MGNKVTSNYENYIFKYADYIIPVFVLTYSVVLTLYSTRMNRVLGWDSFYYLSYTKEMALRWPETFSTLWPKGYPFIASFLSGIGISSYFSLLLISFASLTFTFSVFVKLAKRSSISKLYVLIFLVGFLSTSVSYGHLQSPWSEWLFTGLVTGSAFLFIHWPKTWAIWLSSAAVFSSFCVRYSGLFLVPLMVVFAIINFKKLKANNNIIHVGLAIGMVAILISCLLAVNVLQTGHLSGGSRGSGGGIGALPFHAAHMGWSFISVVSAPQVAHFVGGVESPVGLMIGWTVLSFFLFMCIRPTLLINTKINLNPVFLVVTGYIFSLIVFRSISSFSDLSKPRFLLPVVPLIIVLISYEYNKKIKTLIILIGVTMLSIGIFKAKSETWKIVHGDVSTARMVLDERVERSNSVFVNGNAKRLSAYYEAHFHWVRSSNSVSEVLSSVRSADFVVFLTPESGIHGDKYSPLQSPYQEVCDRSEDIQYLNLLAKDKTGCIIKVDN